MYIWILLVSFIFILFGSYFLFKKDWANPGFLLVLVYTLSVLCCSFNISDWGVQLDLKTFLYLFFGTLIFLLVTYIIQTGFLKKVKKEKEEEKNYRFQIPKWLGVGFFLFNVGCLIFLLLNVLSIAREYGEFTNFSQALRIFKANTSYQKNALLHPVLRILLKFLVANGYVSLLAFIDSLFYDFKNKLLFVKQNIFHVLNIFCVVLCYYFQSNRGSILSLCFAGFVLFAIFYQKKYEKSFSLKKILIIVLLGISALFAFYYSAKLVGRINTKGPLEYITYYAGGSIECFNQYIKNPKQNRGIFGEQTFQRLIKNLNDANIIHTGKPDNIAPFIYYKQTMVGNVYTAYMRWHYDFGVIGMVLLQIIMALFYAGLYYALKYSHNKKHFYFFSYLYAIFVYCIFFHPFDGYFYLEFFCKSGFANLMAFLFVYGGVYFVNKKGWLK